MDKPVLFFAAARQVAKLLQFGAAALFVALALLVGSGSDAQAQFGCTATMYMSQQRAGQTNTHFFNIVTTTNPFRFNNRGVDPVEYNAIALHPSRGNIYALYYDQLHWITANGDARLIGRVANLPNNQYYIAGEIAPNGVYYTLSRDNRPWLYRFNPAAPAANLSAARVRLSRAVHISDLGWHGGYLWGIDQNTNRLARITPGNGAVWLAPQATGAGGFFGAMFGASNGVFGNSNNGGFYKFNTANGQATLLSNSPTTALNDGAKCATTPLNFNADLSVTKTDGKTTYSPGKPVTYTIVVRNHGPFGVADARVLDTLPTGVTGASWTCGGGTGGGRCDRASAAGAINTTVDLPRGATVTFRQTINVPATRTGNLTNTVRVTAPAGFSDTAPANNVATDTDTPLPARVTVSKALVAESITRNNTAQPGERLTYRITIRHADGLPFNNFDFFENVPNGATLVSVTGATGFTAPVTGPARVPLRVAQVPVGGTRTVDVVFRVASPIPGGVSRITNTINGGDVPPNCTTCSVVTPTPATLTLQKTVVNNDGGESTAADFTLRAAGPVTVSGASGSAAVTLASVPPGNYALSETGPGGYTASTYRCSINNATPVVRDSVTLASGQRAVCTITNDDTPPNVAVRKDLVGESIARDNLPEQGEILTYRITLTNTGGAHPDYPLIDVLDGNVVFLDATDGGTPSGNEVHWTLDVPTAQDATTPGTLAVTVRVTVGALAPGEQVVNMAKTTGPDPLCPSDQCVIIPPEPSVTSQKTLVGETGTIANVAEPGERLRYRILLSNVGSRTTTYPHRDRLDPNTVYVSATGGGAHDGSTTGGEVDWTNLDVPAGTPGTPGMLELFVEVDVVDPIPDGVTRIRNLAFDPTKTEPECPSPQCPTIPAAGVVTPDKALVGESGTRPGVAEPGETLTYEITLSNTGGADPDYAFQDVLDPNTTFVSADNGGTHSGGAPAGGVVDWTVAVPAHDGTNPGTFTVTVSVRVNNPLPPGTLRLRNIVKEPGTTDPQCPSEQCVEIPTGPQVSRLKRLIGESGSVQDVAEAGEQLTYEITLTNQAGADPAYELWDVLDPNVTLISASDGGQLSGENVEWTLSMPAHDGTNPGTVVLTVMVQVDDPLPDGVAQIVNIVKEPDIVDPPCPSDQCHMIVTSPQVTRVKRLVGESGTVDGIAEPGEQLTYEITLSNAGGVPDTNYSFLDDYDPNVSVVNADGGSDNGDVITWTGLTVPAVTGNTPGTLVLTVVVQVDDPLPAGLVQLRNIVKKNPNDPDPQCPSDQCVEVPVQSQIVPVKKLVSESGETDGVAEAGETLTYQITLNNNGGATNNYAIQDKLDANTVFVSADNDGVHSDGSPAGGVVDWTGLSVPGQVGTNPGTFVLTVAVKVVNPLDKDVTRLRNVVVEPGSTVDPKCPSDQCVEIPAQEPELDLVKTGTYEDTDRDGVASAGDTIVYSFAVTNAGNVPLADVVPQDEGPKFNGEKGGGKLSGYDPATATLDPGEKRVFEASYILTQVDIDNGAGVEEGVENKATVVGYVNGSRVTGTPVESDGSETRLALPAAASNFSITKVAALRFIRRGEQAPFVIRVTNNAASRADGITVIDTMPSGFRFVDGSATVDGVEATPEVRGRSIVFENLSVAGNEEIEIRLRMLALSSAGPGEHTNRASATDPAGRRLAPPATAIVEIIVEPVFDCGDIVGKVFDDVNGNGYQDAGEPGLPGVRLATVKGWLITTDEFGRFHVACADLPEQRIGTNFIMKLDTRTLPTGYRLTTENPRVVRLTAGKLTKLNFGASIGRVVRLDLAQEAFVPDEVELSERWAAGLDQLIAVLSQEQSVLRLSYIDTGGDPELAEARVRRMKALITERWRQRRRTYPLNIETRVEAGQ